MKLQLINKDPSDLTYDVEFNLSEVDTFNHWFARIPARVGVKVNGNLYRFRTEQEKSFFSYGLGHFFRETEFNTTRIEKLKTQIKESNNKINGFFENVKSYALYQLLN